MPKTPPAHPSPARRAQDTPLQTKSLTPRSIQEERQHATQDIEEFFARLRSGYQAMSTHDKVTWATLVGCFVSTFLPWQIEIKPGYSVPQEVLGLEAGGLFFLFLVVVLAIAISVRQRATDPLVVRGALIGQTMVAVIQVGYLFSRMIQLRGGGESQGQPALTEIQAGIFLAFLSALGAAAGTVWCLRERWHHH